MSALGRALLDFWGGSPRKKSYTATGWHAQVRKLTEHRRGSWAADQVGLDVTQRTVRDWLAEEVEPSKSNRQKINDAYQLLAGGDWDPSHERRTYEIRGVVKIGDDERDRGADGTAPFRVDGPSGTWTRIREGYETGDIDEERAQAWFIEDVIGEDDALNDNSPGTDWTFPGGSYTV